MSTAAQKPEDRAAERTVVHVPMDDDLKAKLTKMAAHDRRKHTDFIRILVEDEWNRRKGKGLGGVLKD